MSGAIRGEPDYLPEKDRALSLLRKLLHQTVTQFGAEGACIALFDKTRNQMVVRSHIRLRSTTTSVRKIRPNLPGMSLPGRPSRRAGSGLTDSGPMPVPRTRSSRESLEEVEDVLPTQNCLFPIGATYFPGQDLIGTVWKHQVPQQFRHEDYLTLYQSVSGPMDVTPSSYVAFPLKEPDLLQEDAEKPTQLLGVVVLYQIRSGSGLHCTREELQRQGELLALYIQNEQMKRGSERTEEHMRRLQQISTAFPIAVKLADLFESVHQFAASVVDVSSMLITIYDRDTRKIYDVYAIHDGERIEGLPSPPTDPAQRPAWWQLAQKEKAPVCFSPTEANDGEYDELMTGIWGDQRQAESFLMLPMKMFKRVVGSVSITSKVPNAYGPEEILVLETMVQIITVSIENAKLYDRAHESLVEAKQREELLAAMNSALQSISLVLDISELLHNIVEFAANLAQAEMCVFFQISGDRNELEAKAIYAPQTIWENEQDAAPVPLVGNRQVHDDLIQMIHLPFKGTFLEHRASDGVFFQLDQQQAEELAQVSDEAGAIFLRETHIERMLMLPVQYQNELIGLLAVHTPRQNRVFKPKEIGMLMAISAQAASAIRNAQLFEKLQENNAELQRMDKLKDEFLVTASHELRTPLSAISGYSSLLRRQAGHIQSEQLLRFSTKISNSAQQLTDLVANMTEAAKMGAVDKKLDMHIAPTQLYPLVEVVVSVMNASQKIKIRVPDILWVEADNNKLRNVLINLLDNATKYSPANSKIEIEALNTTLREVPVSEDRRDHAQLAELGDNYPVTLVRVKDQGEGVDPNDQQRIFEKFVRAPRSLTTPVRGSGLGLYICDRYIDAMNGKLWLEKSVPGEGSIFSFYLLQTDQAEKTDKQDDTE